MYENLVKMYQIIVHRLMMVKQLCNSLVYNGLVNELLINRKLLKQNIKRSSLASLPLLKDDIQLYGGSSISDSNLFPQYASFCEKAATDLNTFQQFRSNPVYKDILEHVPHHVGIKYAVQLRQSNNYDSLIRTGKLIDSIGEPWKFKYKEIGLYSPTTLRYLFFADKIKLLFPTKQILRVCEIGCGFGGQMVALSSIIKIDSATFVDLEPVLTLTKKFTSECKVPFSMEFLGPQSTKQQSYDLFISNYAFSELTRDLQDKYIDLYVRNCKNGFMLWNSLSFKKLDGYSLEELLEKIPNSYKEKEFPSTSADNHLIYW